MAETELADVSLSVEDAPRPLVRHFSVFDQFEAGMGINPFHNQTVGLATFSATSIPFPCLLHPAVRPNGLPVTASPKARLLLRMCSFAINKHALFPICPFFPFTINLCSHLL